MSLMNPAFGFEKTHSKQSLTLAFTLALFALTLALVGCTGLSQGSNNSSQTPQQMSILSTLPGANVGSNYQQVLSVSGGSAPYNFVVSQGQLPTGLALNATTGSISGIPTEVATYAFTITVTDAAGQNGASRTVAANGPPTDSGSRAYTVAIAKANAVTVQVSPSEASVAASGKVQFSATVSNTSNTAVTWSASAGTISSSGLFTAPASGSSITITATSVADTSAKATATATTTSAQFAILTTSLPFAVESSQYSATLAAAGGQPPYQWSIASGSLPAGVQLSSAGVFSGSPSVAGTFPITVQASDSSSHTAQQSYSLIVSGNGLTCGPPTYNCSRTDFNTAQVPSAVPNVGTLVGANKIITDPDFNNRVVRITDANTNTSASFINRSYFTTSSGSADENIWNLDSTLLIVQDTGANGYPYTFNPSTMQAARMYVSSFPTSNGLKLSGGGEFSHVNANILFAPNGTTVQKYDFTDRVNPPAAQLVYDFTSSPNCLGTGYNPTWRTDGGISFDDTVFGMGYSNKGGQGTGFTVVAYKAGSGCTMLNTQTGQVTGDWGTKGTINIPDRWLVHNVKISKDGNWLVIATAGCLIANCNPGPYFWQIGTTNVLNCGMGGLCSGHWTEGYTHWVNNNNTPLADQVKRVFATPSSAARITGFIPSTVVGTMDQHQSWNNVDPGDTVPFASATWTPIFPFPGPWFNEIIAVSSDGSDVTWRFAHSFITAQSQDFSTMYAIGSVSQDGKFFAFSSDWMGTLGSTSGTSTCNLGTTCRGDVFVVEMR